MFVTTIILLVVLIGSAGNCIAGETLSANQAKQEIKHAILNLRMQSSKNAMKSTSYTVAYRHRGVNSPGYLTENPFWVPESVGDLNVIYYDINGRITVAYDGNTLYIDDKRINIVGTKDDDSTKSMNYLTPTERRIWRYPNGLVYQNTKEGLQYDVFTNTHITTDSAILSSILYSNVTIPAILTPMQESLKSGSPDIMNYDFPNLEINLSSPIAEISFDMPQKVAAGNLRMRYEIDVISNTLLRESILVPPCSSTSLFIDKHYKYEQSGGFEFLSEVRSALPNQKYLKHSMLEWKLEGKPVINGSVIIPEFTTAPLVSR